MLPAALRPTTLSGERRVFQALEEIDWRGAAALHSLNLPEHRYKVSAEADFVVVLDDLVLVVEVKAAGVSCRGGIWTYYDREGHWRSSPEGPFRQADSAMYALKDRLRNLLGERWLRDVAFGWVVVTPDVDLARSVEWAEETYIGRGPFSRAGGLEAGLRRARTYWVDKQPGCGPLSSARREELLQTLRPDFELVPSLGARTENLEATFVRLTGEQLSRLDMLEENDRVLCSGGAGTGKTFLAAEVARREGLLGRRVALVCRSAVLAALLRSKVTAAGADVVTYAEVGAAGQDAYDVLVVDEAQDLMTFDCLDALDRGLVGGLGQGRWSFFYDPNSQSRLHGAYDPAAEEWLTSVGAVRAKLTRNCRNTRQIAFQTRAHTGADLGVASAGNGPEVQFPPVTDRVDEVRSLEAHLRNLRAQEVPDSAITLLSARGEWETTTARELKACRKGKLRRLDHQLAADWPPEQMTWASVVDFKGLENSFVCVIDLDDLSGARDLDVLYVAMTRARAGLWVATRPRVGRRLAGLFREHASAALPVLKEAAR